MSDYQRIAAAIHYLDQHWLEQPDLAALAHAAQLSPSHLHKLFSRWAGITPKDFLQILTLQRAKQLLQDGHSVLDAALDSGLSGPSRLHDLAVTLEAASPGEIKSGGAGWTLEAGFADSPFGKCLIGHSPRGICHWAFVEPSSEDSAWNELQTLWPNARLRQNDGMARATTIQAFTRANGNGHAPALRVFVRGTAFQVRVWRALLRVPEGTLVSYRQLAQAIGLPLGSRPVGSAVAQNTLAFLIPCHRVIRSTGAFGEYRWGAVRKRAITAWEIARREAAPLTR